MADAESKIVPKLWGQEKIIVNNPLYCGKILTVVPNGMACSVHYHKNKTETFHILRGQLEFEKYDAGGRLQERTALRAGDTISLPPSTPHRFWVLREICEFIEFSTHDDPSDSYRLIPSGPRPD
jgi:mannose-6-phosphate isomerase-like protein (cupin superfamily)